MRRFPVTITFKKLYEANEIPPDADRIVRDMTDELYTDDYRIEFDERRYRRSGLARDVTRLLYRCPNCQTFEGLKVKRPYRTNQVECASCFSTWRLTSSNRLVPLDEEGLALESRVPLYQCYREIKKMPLAPLGMSNPLQLQDGEVLLLRSRSHVLGRETVFPRIRTMSVGRMYLTNRRLIFRNRYRVVLDAPLQALSGLSTEAANRFNFVYGGRIYNIPIRTESILKWFDTIGRLQEEIALREREVETAPSPPG